MTDWYDCATEREKMVAAREYLEGPRQSIAGVHPGATEEQKAAIAQKRYADKFLRSDPCPMGHYLSNHVAPLCVRDRLIAEGYLNMQAT